VNPESTELGLSEKEILSKLGPLATLAGTWEGDKGIDEAPGADRGLLTTPFRERASFAPMDAIDNHEQLLFGLRYSRTAWRLGEVDPFHEELGYWLWDAAAGQVMCAFVIPRGVSVLAGGRATAADRRLVMAADVGSHVFGIASNPFLDVEFKTVRFELEVEIEGDRRFRYAEDTQLRMMGRSEIFHHRDSNRLSRVG
jgi:hypothetical protein